MTRAIMSKAPSCLIVFFLLVAPLALIAGPAGAATTIDKLGTGNKDETIIFSGPGEDTSLFLSIPKGCTVTSAGMALEGMPIISAASDTRSLNYNDTTDGKSGWRASTSDNLSSTQKTPAGFQGGQFSAGDTAALASDDGVYVTDMGKMIAYYYHSFKYVVNMVELTEIIAEWDGYASYMDGNTWETKYGAQMYIWNNGTQAWELLDYYDDWKDPSDHWLKGTVSGANLDGYLYNGNEVRIVVQNIYSDQSSTYADIYSDYASLTITGKPVEYPSDVKLDVNDDGSIEAQRAGTLIGMLTYGGTDFKTLLQTFINLEGAGQGNLDIPLSVSSSTAGKVRVGNVSIVIEEYVNKAPVADQIPGTFHFAEDTDAANLINLTHYFSDDMDKVWDMTYAIVNESDPDLIHATVSTHGLMSFTTPTENWFGSATFKVKATDSSGLSATSEAFTVTVDPAPDDPVLKPVGALAFTEGKAGTVSVSATDPDNLFGGSDLLTYSAVFMSGKQLFTLNPSSGVAIFQLKDSDVGSYTVNFTVTDSTDRTDSEDVTLTVSDVNNAPVLAPVGKQTLNEDEAFILQLEATDIDASDLDHLSYTAEFKDGMVLFEMGTDGHLAFTPNQSMVGQHTVKFTVTDTGPLTDSEDVVFDIRNVNDPPTVKPIPDKTVNRNTPFSLKVEGNDPDLGYEPDEVLGYEDNSNLFDIDMITGWINFTPTTAQAGKTYTITVTVSDAAGQSVTTSFKLEVVLNNTAPAAVIKVDGNKTKVKEGRAIVLRAEASDADNDPLTYKWTEKTKELGTGSELSLKGLKAGKHTIVLEVSDGITKTTVQQVISIEKSGTGLPGFDATLVVMALAVAGMLSLGIAKKRKE